MPIWVGETWTCAACGWANAIIRNRCRNCYSLQPDEVADKKRDEAVQRSQDEGRQSTPE